jgi:hypothetical protein
MSVKKLLGLLIVGGSAAAVALVARRKPIVPPTAPTVPTAAPTVAPTAVVPPPTPPTVAPPPPTPPAPPIVSGTLECHAYANSTEVSATVVISGYAKTLVTPFTIELPAGTYTLTATYSGQTQTVTVKIELGKTVRIDFKFALPVTPPPTAPIVTLPSECRDYVHMGPAEFDNAERALMNAIKHYEEQIKQLQRLSVYNDKYVVVTKAGGPLYAPYWANIKHIEINEPLLGGVVALYDTESDAERARQAWLAYQPTAHVMKFSDYLSSVIATYQRALDANKAELERMERCRPYMEQIWAAQRARILGR